MAQLQYIGARYVPKYYENSVDPSSSEWEPGKVYEALTVVTWNDVSYTSKIPVPATVGAPDLFPAYWVKNADMPAAIHALQEEISDIKNGEINDGALDFEKLSTTCIDRLHDKIKMIVAPVSYYDPNIPNESSGECIVIQTRNNKQTIMFDTGAPHSYAAIKQCLIDNDISHVDYFILSHYHGDHCHNLGDMINDGFIDADTIAYLPRTVSIMTGSWVTNENDVRTLLSVNTTYAPDSNSPLTVDGITITFLNGDAADVAYYEAQSITDGNTYSVVNYIYAENTVIFNGSDLSDTAADYLISNDKIEHCNIMYLPHHGFKTSLDPRLFLLSNPDVALASQTSYWNSPNNPLDYEARSAQISYLNQMNVPVYSSGFGAIYAGIDNQDYCVIPNGRDLVINPADATVYKFVIYVDDTYTGEISNGDSTTPFKTLTAAIAYANSLKRSNNIEINIVGTYNHPTENITACGFERLTITHSGSGYSNDVTIGQLVLFSGYYVLQRININTTEDLSIYAYNSLCNIQYCQIDGDNTATNNYRGLGVFGGAAWLSHVTINNKNVALYTQSGGDIVSQQLDGSGNITLISGNMGGDVALQNNSNITFTNFIKAFGTERVPVSSANFMNKFCYADSGSYTYYAAAGLGTTHTDVLDLTDSIFNAKIVRVYSNTGEVVQGTIKGSNFNNLATVQAATDATQDAAFAVSASGRLLSITYSQIIKVEII